MCPDLFSNKASHQHLHLQVALFRVRRPEITLEFNGASGRLVQLHLEPPNKRCDDKVELRVGQTVRMLEKERELKCGKLTSSPHTSDSLSRSSLDSDPDDFQRQRPESSVQAQRHAGQERCGDP